MPALVSIRPLTAPAEATVRRLAQSRPAPARAVERAAIVRLAHQGRPVPAIARELAVGEATVRRWLKRFNADGRAGRADAARVGRPPTYAPAQVGEGIAARLTAPQELGLAFASWTLDRLASHLAEARSLPIKRRRSAEMLAGEGLRWRRQEPWFGERVAPAFAEKRGPSSPAMMRRPPAAS